MRAAVVFVLLFATVLCRPAKKVSASSSASSSEEVVRRPLRPAVRKLPVLLAKSRPAPARKFVAPPAPKPDDSVETSEEFKVQVVAAPAEPEAPVQTKALAVDPTTEAPPVDKTESEDSDDDDEDEEDSDEDEDESSDSSDSESGESSTPVPVTMTPAPATHEPAPETTVESVLPTIVVDPDSGRGDSLGGYPSDYKSIVYVEEKSYHKAPGPYKSYEVYEAGKKSGYDMSHGNEVEKSSKMYNTQAFGVQADILEGDTSTPEVETLGLDTSSGTSEDQGVSARQASLPEEEPSVSESSSVPEEEQSASSGVDSASAEEEEEEESSEEATATPGAADSDSEESDSAESDSEEEDEDEGAGPTDLPEVVTAK